MSEVQLRSGKELVDFLYKAAETCVTKDQKGNDVYGVRFNVGTVADNPNKYIGNSNGRMLAGWPVEIDAAESNKVFTLKFEEHTIICDKELEPRDSKIKGKSYLGVLNVEEGKDLLFYIKRNVSDNGPYIRIVIKAGKPKEVDVNSVGGYNV